MTGTAIVIDAQASVSGLVPHLEQQVASARRLLRIVLAQGDAIRDQDTEGVLALLADIQTELMTRDRLELERDGILRAAAARLGISLDQVDLEAVLAVAPPHEGDRARALSAELRGLLQEVERTHDTNRVLIRQELSFLAHLMRVLSGTPSAGYSATGWQAAPQAVRSVDARA
jgi:hypothetical protein